jgi:integrase
MSWDPNQSRWCKMHKGIRYVISCATLGAPATKEGSREAANAWWEKKRAEIDAGGKPAARVFTEAERVGFAAFGTGVEDFHKDSAGEDAAEVEEVIRKVAAAGRLTLLRELLAGKALPPEVEAALAPDRARELEVAAGTIRGEAATPEKTVHALADRWRKGQQSQVEAGVMSAARAGNNKNAVAFFVNYLGAQSDVGGIDADKLEGFYHHLLGRLRSPARPDGLSVRYAVDILSVAKQFVRWAWSVNALELPKNIGKKFRLGTTLRTPIFWTADEFRLALSESPGKLKAALLVMANTGGTQGDVSDLLDAEVDWKAGRIIRKRSKTRNEAGVPVVNYRLWDSTFSFLKQYRSGGERVFVNEAGGPLLSTRLRDDGQLVKSDALANMWDRVRARTGLRKTLKGLRKTGASVLATHEVYGRFDKLYLGHSPEMMADRHYTAPPQELFDEAVSWLGARLGQVS